MYVHLYTLIAALVVAAAGWIVADRQRSIVRRHRFAIKDVIENGRGRDRVSLRTADLAQVFKLEDSPGRYRRKNVGHPAVLTPARRAKL